MNVFENFRRNEKELIVLALFMLSLLTVFSIHFVYPFLYHSDAWDHIKIARSLGEEKGKIVTGFNWEIGYTVWLRIIDLLTFNNLINIAIFIPMVLGFILSLGGFVLVRHLFKNNLMALFSAIFVLLLKSNATLMGTWFLVPLAFGLAMTPLLLYFFIRFLEVKKMVWPFLAIFAQSTLTHPVYTILLLPIFAIYLIINPSLIKRNQLKIAIGVIALILLLPFFSFQLGIKEFSYSLPTMKLLYSTMAGKLTFDWASNAKQLFYLNEFLGEPLFYLSLIGFGLIVAGVLFIYFWKFFKKEFCLLKEYFFDKRQSILAISFIVLLLLYLQFHLSGKIFLAPYERMFLALALVFLLTAGIGFYFIVEFIKRIVFYLELETGVRKIVLSILILCIFFFLFTEIISASLIQKNELYQNISLEGIPSVQWLNENSKKEESILAVPWHSLAIRGLIERKVFGTPQTRGGEGFGERSMIFILSNCREKKEIMEELNPNYLFFESVYEEKMECNFLNKVYEKEGFIVLKPVKS